MKNVTKILTAAVLCAALFASTERINSLGGNAAFWPGDEANIAAFPAQVNNHSFLQIDGVGCDGNDCDEGNASLLINKDGTTWGFNYGVESTDWVNMSWGNGDMGVTVGMEGGDAGGAMSVSWGGDFGFGEMGIHYTDEDDGGDASLGVNWRKDCGLWIFDDAVVWADDLMADDLEFSGAVFTHMAAGSADVMFAWGMDYDGADDGGMTQTAAIGVEAPVTDWATLRGGYNWAYDLTCEGDGCETGGTESSFAWGLGFNWGGFTADMSISTAIFQDPMGTFSGQNGEDLTDGTLTFTYNF